MDFIRRDDQEIKQGRSPKRPGEPSVHDAGLTSREGKRGERSGESIVNCSTV